MADLMTMRDVFAHDLQALYSAETQALAGQTRLAEAATDAKLKAAFEKHGRETERQVERLEQLMKAMGVTPGREVNAAVRGLLEDAQKLLRKSSTPELLDAMLIAAAQKVEHYEISCYGTAVTMAKDLGLADAAALLGETLDEEKRTDEILNELAKNRVNVKAEA